jgi:hypothetical protein
VDDTSTLATLYSALIQGGATLIAVLGAFLLTFGPARSQGWASSLRNLERMERAYEQVEAARVEFDNESAELDGRTVDIRRRLLLGEISDEQARGELATLLRRREERLSAAQARLAENQRHRAELTELREDFEWHDRVTDVFYDAGETLVYLVACCLVVPAVLLGILPIDPEPFGHSAFAVAVYAAAVLLIADLVRRAGAYHRVVKNEDDDTAPEVKQRKEPDEFRRLLHRFIKLCLIGMFLVTFIDLPRELVTSPLFGDRTEQDSVQPATPKVSR